MIRRLSLRIKIFTIAVLLALISTIISLSINLVIGYQIVSAKDNEINEMLLTASKENVNLILIGISDMLYQLQSSDDLKILSGEERHGDYENSRAIRDYTAFINDFLVLHEEIETIIINTGKLSFLASNISLSNEDSSTYFSPYMSDSYFQSVENMVNERINESYFLDIGKNPQGINKILICNPIFNSDATNMSAYILVVLSEDIVDQFKYAASGFIIRDELGNNIDIGTKQKVRLSQERSNNYLIKPLVFDNWSLIQTANSISFFTYLKSYRWIIIVSAIVLIPILVISAFVARKLILSLKTMKQQIEFMVENKNLTEKIHLPDRRVKFKTALMLFFIFMAVLPVIYVGSMSIAANNNLIQNRMSDIFLKNVDIVTREFEFLLNRYEKNLFEIAFNKDIQEIFQWANHAEREEYPIRNSMNRTILSGFLLHSNISDMVFFDREKKLFYSATLPEDYYQRTDFRDNIDYLANNHGDYLWQWTEGNFYNRQKMRIGMPVLNIIPDTVNYGKILGYLLLDFNTELITEMFYSLTANSAAMILRDRSDQAMVVSAPIGFDFENIRSETLRQHYYLENRILDNGIMTLGVYLSKYIYQEDLNKLYTYSFSVIFLLIIVGGIVAILFYTLMNRKIFILGNVAREINRKNVEVRYPLRGHDEIDELGSSFNEMLDNLHTLMEDKVALQLKSKEQEFNILQSQIKPHFLYNTLRSVQHMASKGDVRAADVIKKLIFLFKTSSYGPDNDEDSLRNEVKRVQYYLEIQQLRFSDKFIINLDISDAVLDCRILKLTIQPVVENSIYHGLETKEGLGHIDIHVKKSKKSIIIKIKDDGNGISEENMDIINEQLSGKIPTKSIGIMNVHNRIQLHYGGSFGLSIKSSLGIGTEVKMILPIIN
jgi:two-component system, sensor histidine kinase YesM